MEYAKWKTIFNFRAAAMKVIQKAAEAIWLRLSFSRILTCARAMPSVLQSCQRTSDWPDEYEVNVKKDFFPESIDDDEAKK